MNNRVAMIPRGAAVYRGLIRERIGLLSEERYEDAVLEAVELCTRALLDGRKIFWMGNGGSAADAQHMAAEFTGRFLRERRGLPSEALSTNTSTLTAIANDFGYEHVFRRQIEALVVPGDVVIGITTSGNSENIVRGLVEAKERGARTIAMTGNGGGKVADVADVSIIGPSGYSALVQEIHITLGHIICDLVEQNVIEAERA